MILVFLILLFYLFIFDLYFTFLGFIVFIIFLFLTIGLLTVLERKVLSFLGCREGPMISFKGFMSFFLDFLKLIFKACNYNCLIFISFFCLFLFFSIFYFLPYNSQGGEVRYGYLLFFLFEVFFIVFKCLYFSLYNGKFVIISTYRLKYNSLFCDVLIFIIITPVFFLYNYYNLTTWNDVFNFFYFYDFIIMSPLCYTYMVVLLLQVSRTPFDYFESESEMVGGCSTDLGGGAFIIWSFIEYGEIIIKSSFFVFFFFPFLGCSYVSVFFITIFVFLLLVLRGVIPRFDYFTSLKFFLCKMLLISNIVVFVYFIVIFFIYII